MRKKKRKHNKIVFLAESRLNSIGNIMSKALTKNKISHGDFLMRKNIVN